MLFVNNSSKAKKMQLVVNLLHFVVKKIVYWFILKNNLYAEIMGGHKNDWTGSE